MKSKKPAEEQIQLAKKYLEEHGISDETAEMFELTYDDKYLNIPIKDEEGEDSFIKSRNLHFEEGGEEPKYKNSTGSHATLFNYYSVKDSSSLVLTEGELDTMKLMQEGIPAVSSTGGAGTFPSNFTDLLKDKKIYICYDNDNAGKKGARNVLEQIPNARIISLPEGVKDVCEYFHAGKTKDNFLKLMRVAQTKIEWEASNLPEEFKLINGEEMNSIKIEQLPWIIESVLYTEGFCLVYGAEGIGKSFIALSLALAAATGEPWMNVFEVKTKTNVLYLDKENPISRIARRVKNMGGAPKNLYWLKYPEHFSLHNGKGGISDFAVALTTLVEEKKIGLIVVDSFVDLMVGSESSAEDTQRFFSALRQLFPKLSLLVLHHENKPSQGVYRNSSQRIRGSSNINAQCDTMFRLEAVAKSKTEMTLQQTKNRDEQKMDKFMIRMIVQKDPEDEKSIKTIVTGFEYLGIVADTAADNKGAEAEDLITDALSEALACQLSRQQLTDIATEAGIAQRTLDRALKDMEDRGDLKRIKNGKQVWFGLSSPIVSDETNAHFEGGLL